MVGVTAEEIAEKKARVSQARRSAVAARWENEKLRTEAAAASDLAFVQAVGDDVLRVQGFMQFCMGSVAAAPPDEARVWNRIEKQRNGNTAGDKSRRTEGCRLHSFAANIRVLHASRTSMCLQELD